jgi:formate hydrogenlyase subunit 3/multisubunit Na+/H+ antiporter MnhD subunit
MLWTHGIDIPPPLFMPFWSIVVFMGALFAVGFGAYAALFILPMWLMRVENTPIVHSLVATVFVDLFFGVIRATYFRYQAKKLQLPSWDKYPAD